MSSAATFCPECSAPGGRIHAFSCSRYPEVACEASVHRHEVELPENAHALVNVVNFKDQKGSVA